MTQKLCPLKDKFTEKEDTGSLAINKKVNY